MTVQIKKQRSSWRMFWNKAIISIQLLLFILRKYKSRVRDSKSICIRKRWDKTEKKKKQQHNYNCTIHSRRKPRFRLMITAMRRRQRRPKQWEWLAETSFPLNGFNECFDIRQFRTWQREHRTQYAEIEQISRYSIFNEQSLKRFSAQRF